MATVPVSFSSEYAARQQYYSRLLNGPVPEPSAELLKLLHSRSFKAIAVYPEAVPWEPLQRPQQLLRELAARGYMCFFCDPSPSPGFQFREEEPNLFVVSGEAYLIPVLRSLSVVVLCTWPLQMAWADLLPHKVLWYDILDRPDFLSLYDNHAELKHRDLVRHADALTYSAQALRPYVADRPDAVYMPNGVRTEDFRRSPSEEAPPDLQPILSEGKPIIGFYGAHGSWLDGDLIRRTASDHPEWSFVFLGPVDPDVTLPEGANLHFLGPKPYRELPGYCRFFHAAWIPFLHNAFTDTISPVKFFEYQAMGLPVAAVPLAELLPYAGRYVRLAAGPEPLQAELAYCLREDIRHEAAEACRATAEANHWRSRTDTLERLLQEGRSSCWKAYANVFPQAIAMMSVTFFDYAGQSFYSGGAERYLVDLARLSHDLGYGATLYQYGDFPWVRRFGAFDVVSLSRGGQNARSYSIPSVRTFNRLFQEQVRGGTAARIYSSYFNAWPFEDEPDKSIGIIHGIAWDNERPDYTNGAEFWESNRRFIEGVDHCTHIVSVDTNSANWLQTVRFAAAQQIKVIPNYADLNEYRPAEDLAERDGSRIRILYPRRLYRARGLHWVLDILDPILERHPEAEFHFVGQGEDRDVEPLREKQRKWGSRVRWYSLPMDAMPEAYREADITLIPTSYSEGTSLSCLEAMASGNAVIATRIGGLTDLVLDGYNGLLIDPGPESLLEAVESLIQDQSLRRKLGQKAVETAACFSKEKWKSKWAERLRRVLSVGDGGLPARGREQSRLTEFRLPRWPEAGTPCSALILERLQRGDLVYLRLLGREADRVQSFGRLQLVGWDEPAHARPDEVIAAEGLTEAADTRADVRLAEGEY